MRRYLPIPPPPQAPRRPLVPPPPPVRHDAPERVAPSLPPSTAGWPLLALRAPSRRPIPLAPLAPVEAAPRRPMPPLAPTPTRRPLVPLAPPPAPQAPSPSLRRHAPLPTAMTRDKAPYLPPGLWPARVFGRHPVTGEVIAIQHRVAGYFQLGDQVNPIERNRQNGVPEEVAQAVIDAAFRETEDGGTVWAGGKDQIDWNATE